MKGIGFIVRLKYYTLEEGGRSIPAESGYRQQVKFDFDEVQTSGMQTFTDKEIVYPGETVDAEIRILSVNYFSGQLYKGLVFEF